MGTRLYDLINTVKSVQSIKPQAAAAGTFNGASVDAREAYSVLWLMDVGAVAGAPTDMNLDTAIQDSDDDTTFAAATDEAAAAIAFAQVDEAAGGPDKIYELMDKLHANAKAGNRPSKRFRRAQAVVAFTGGTTPTVGLAVTGLLIRRFLPS